MSVGMAYICICTREQGHFPLPNGDADVGMNELALNYFVLTTSLKHDTRA